MSGTKRKEKIGLVDFRDFTLNVMYLICYPYIFEHKDRVHLVTCV